MGGSRYRPQCSEARRRDQLELWVRSKGANRSIKKSLVWRDEDSVRQTGRRLAFQQNEASGRHLPLRRPRACQKTDFVADHGNKKLPRSRTLRPTRLEGLAGCHLANVIPSYPKTLTSFWLSRNVRKVHLSCCCTSVSCCLGKGSVGHPSNGSSRVPFSYSGNSAIS